MSRLQLVVPVNLTVLQLTVLIAVVSVSVVVTIFIMPGVSVARIDVPRIAVHVPWVWVRVSRVDVAWVVVGVSNPYGYPRYTEVHVEVWVSRRR